MPYICHIYSEIKRKVDIRKEDIIVIDTKNFRTKTIFMPRKNPGTDSVWEIALDIGYSAIKGFSPNSVYCFPSYATKITKDRLNIGKSSYDEILYRDCATQELWSVGASAQRDLSDTNSQDSLTALYGRNRYFSPMFLVIARVGLALGMIANNYGAPSDKPLVLQTGLPPAYLKSDTPLLKEVLGGKHEFDVKVGNEKWTHFSFELPESNISVMAQPMGTLISIATDYNGRFTADANKYFSSKIIILDPGFGTFDTFCIRNKAIDSWETFDNLGMKRVFTETVDKIFKEHGVEITVPAIQKHLETGDFEKFIRKERRTDLIPFADILDECNTMVCQEALEKLDTIYNNMLEFDYMVITGGTGSAWRDQITEYYSGMKKLKILYGGQNDTIDGIFANVRGYYMYQLARMRTLERKGK